MEQLLERINRSALKFLVPLSEQEVYKTIVDEARRLFEAEYGSIMLANNGKLIKVYASAPLYPPSHSWSKKHSLAVYKSRNPVVYDVRRMKDSRMIKQKGIRSVIHIPLSYKDESIGVLAIHTTKQKKLTKGELHILKLYGSMASLAIRKMQLYRQTMSALELRDSFISLASHELRTPLTSMSGYVQLLHSKMRNADSTESRWVKELYIECGRLTKLIKELLAVNRIKQGQLDFVFQECSFCDVVEHAVTEFKRDNPQCSVSFRNSVRNTDGLIIADQDKLRSVVSQILANAAKFSHYGSIISISLSCTKSQVLLQVRDEGEGVGQKHVSRVFEGFYKGDNNHTEGMGLGLLLAKHIIQSHKGQISIDSLRKGTLLKVRLPKIKWDEAVIPEAVTTH